MSSELVRTLSLSALLLACAHGKGTQHDPDAVGGDEGASSQAAAEPDHDRSAGDTAAGDADRAASRDQDRGGVEVPARREQDRGRMAAAGDELPSGDGPRGERRPAQASEGTELNVLDQGNSERDIDLTQRIRKALMDDDALSFKAKNTKVITRDGHVTLRGSVKTPEEKAAIGKAAIAAAGAAHVTNQIEVEP